jgi:hypothetical protein
VISADVAADTWGGFKRLAAANKGVARSPRAASAATSSSRPHSRQSAGGAAGSTANRTLLLGGRKDGHICVFNMDSGKVEFEIEVPRFIVNFINASTVDSRYYDTDRIRKMYQYNQTIDITNLNSYCLGMVGIQIWYRNKQYFVITDIVVTRVYCICTFVGGGGGGGRGPLQCPLPYFISTYHCIPVTVPAP